MFFLPPRAHFKSLFAIIQQNNLFIVNPSTQVTRPQHSNFFPYTNMQICVGRCGRSCRLAALIVTSARSFFRFPK
ncbi:hypothetical protein L596_030325 [Steinernema carpocapsae]|uniref:Uncharacterized protein n=1 Tax=Steinernema carpocapsae TaxID=34508 RepID=A0A4U5LP19_STECR|nr:hypothetical protein L596_030325 [Steinernema carpocapsae]